MTNEDWSEQSQSTTEATSDTVPMRRMFLRLREAAQGFDTRLRSGFADGDLATVQELLSRLRDNVADRTAGGAADR